MKKVDIVDMLQYLESQIRNVNIYIREKYDEKSQKEAVLFDLFESDYKNISLDKEYVIRMFNNVADKIKDILFDAKQCGIHFEDFGKAASDFHKYCEKNNRQIEENSKRFGIYQHELFKQVKENVNSEMLYEFNNTFTNSTEGKFFHSYTRRKGGNENKRTLFDMIYSEITNLPLNRMNDAFDEKGHFLGINNIPYDTSMRIRESVRKDTNGNPMFAIEYKRNTFGFFECLRIQIENKWFILYEE